MAVVVMGQNRGTSCIEYFWNSSLNQSNSLISLPKKAISVTNMCDITFLIYVITSITFTLIISFNLANTCTPIPCCIYVLFDSLMKIHNTGNVMRSRTNRVQLILPFYNNP